MKRIFTGAGCHPRMTVPGRKIFPQSLTFFQIFIILCWSKKEKTMSKYSSSMLTGHRCVMNQLFKAVITAGTMSG